MVSSNSATISLVHALTSQETVLNDTIYRFFRRSNQPSEAWKSLTFNFSENSMTLVLNVRAETTTALLQTVRSHSKIDWSKFAKNPSLKRSRFELFPFFTASNIFSLFFNQVDGVLFDIHALKQPLTWDCHFLLPSVRYIYF